MGMATSSTTLANTRSQFAGKTIPVPPEHASEGDDIMSSSDEEDDSESEPELVPPLVENPSQDIRVISQTQFL
jgi:hypothetical protein